MEPKLISEKQLVAAARAIKAAGSGLISEKIYRDNIMPGLRKEANRSIAVAKLVCALSSERYKDEWYTVALFKGASRYLHPSKQKEAYGVALLEKAGISKSHAYALLETASDNKDISDYSELALAIKFAEIHTDDKGNYLHAVNDHSAQSEETSRDRIVTLFTLKKRNRLAKYEKILSEEMSKGEHHVGGKKEAIPGAVKTEPVWIAPQHDQKVSWIKRE